MENKNMLQKLFGFNSHSMQVRTEILRYYYISDYVIHSCRES